MRVWAFPFFAFSLYAILASAQFTDKTFDGVFASLKDDSSKVDSLNKLCRLFDDNEKAIASEKKVLELARKLNYKKGIAQSLNNIGVAYYNLNEGKQALEYHRQALTIREALLEQAVWNGNPDETGRCKKDVSASYTNIGNAYDNLGDKKKAIEFHTKSLNFKQELKDTAGMAKSYYNIASAYLDLPDYYKAIDNGFKAVKLYDAIGEKSGNLSNSLNNIGLAYERLKDFDKALDYYEKALAIQKQLGNQREIAKLLDNLAIIYHLQGQKTKDNIIRASKFHSALENYSKALDILAGSDDNDITALVYNNIGNTYWELNDFPNALTALNKSLDAYKKLNNKSGIASALNSLATHFKLQKNFSQSIKYSLQAFAIADSIDDPEQIKNSCEILSDDYYELKQFERSLLYYKKYIAEKDTLTNVEGAKRLVQEESRQEFEIREQKLKFDQEKKDAIAATEKRKQQIIMWSVVCGLLLVIAFAGFIFRSLRETRKQKNIIELQKNEVERQKTVVEEKNALIEIQKMQVEVKNKEITDSIVYAKRIQYALLASDSYIKKNLAKDFFVLFRPKDIVSGDFYWATAKDKKFYLAVCDSTGHGVPGAFMSLLNISFLNEAINEKQIEEPNEILNYVRKRLIQNISQDGTQDGMDGILVCFNKENNSVSYAAANNAPLLIRKNELEYLDLDKMPIGKGVKQDSFRMLPVSFNPGDVFYLYTDGYADQFGGAKGKKFKYKQLEEKLLAINDKPLAEQKELLDKTFIQWKGNLEQVDDVCIIGIRM